MEPMRFIGAVGDQIVAGKGVYRYLRAQPTRVRRHHCPADYERPMAVSREQSRERDTVVKVPTGGRDYDHCRSRHRLPRPLVSKG